LRPTDLDRVLRAMRASIDKALSDMPTHSDYVARLCA
jgi:hypothetical protein